MVGKVFCKVLNNRLVKHLDKGRALHEGQADTLNELVQGRLKEGKAFFLDVQKAYDI